MTLGNTIQSIAQVRSRVESWLQDAQPSYKPARGLFPHSFLTRVMPLPGTQNGWGIKWEEKECSEHYIT